MHERTMRLRELMAEHGLTIQDVARITDRTENTVRIWRSRHGDRIIPATTLRLIEVEAQLVAQATRGRAGE